MFTPKDASLTRTRKITDHRRSPNEVIFSMATARHSQGDTGSGHRSNLPSKKFQFRRQRTQFHESLDPTRISPSVCNADVPTGAAESSFYRPHIHPQCDADHAETERSTRLFSWHTAAPCYIKWSHSCASVDGLISLQLVLDFNIDEGHWDSLCDHKIWVDHSSYRVRRLTWCANEISDECAQISPQCSNVCAVVFKRIQFYLSFFALIALQTCVCFAVELQKNGDHYSYVTTWSCFSGRANGSSD